MPGCTSLARRPQHHVTSTNIAWKNWPISNLSQQHPICRNTSQHLATGWPNGRNMLRPVILRYLRQGESEGRISILQKKARDREKKLVKNSNSDSKRKTNFPSTDWRMKNNGPLSKVSEDGSSECQNLRAVPDKFSSEIKRLLNEIEEPAN